VEIGEKIGEKKKKRDRDMDRGAGDKQRAHERPRKKHSKHGMDGTYMRMIYTMTKTKKGRSQENETPSKS
jgi:hypothetical protein